MRWCALLSGAISFLLIACEEKQVVYTREQLQGDWYLFKWVDSLNSIVIYDDKKLYLWDKHLNRSYPDYHVINDELIYFDQPNYWEKYCRDEYSPATRQTLHIKSLIGDTLEFTDGNRYLRSRLANDTSENLVSIMFNVKSGGMSVCHFQSYFYINKKHTGVHSYSDKMLGVLPTDSSMWRQLENYVRYHEDSCSTTGEATDIPYSHILVKTTKRSWEYGFGSNYMCICDQELIRALRYECLNATFPKTSEAYFYSIFPEAKDRR